MAAVFSLETERRLVWDTDIPSEYHSRTSPDFYFQNCELFFQLSYWKCANAFTLYMYSKREATLFQPFEITSYIDNKNDSLMFRTSKYGPEFVKGSFTGISLNEFPEIDKDKNIDFKSTGRIKIAIIFRGEIGSTLRLKSETENSFRNVAVGTSVESADAATQSSANSTLEILSSDFSKLLDEDLYQDVELKCEDETFKAHKNVLSTRSKVFLAMLQSAMLEGQTARVEVKDMKSDVCKELLRYMYCGKLPELTSKNARCLYEAGDRYNVSGLMEPCAEFLVNNLTLENSCEMLVLADAHSDKIFKENVIQFMIDKKIPLEDDSWTAFCRSQPLLANEVLNRCYRSLIKKELIPCDKTSL